MSIIDVGTMKDGRFEVFRVRNGEIVHRWNAQGGGWSPKWESLGKPGKGAVAVQVRTMPDGRFEIFAVDSDGEVFNCWWKKEGGWSGSKPGQRAGWQSLGK